MRGLHVVRCDLARSVETPDEWRAVVIVRMILLEAVRDTTWQPRHVSRHVADLVCTAVEEQMPPNLDWYYVDTETLGEADGMDYVWCAKVRMKEGLRGVTLEKPDAEWNF